MSAKRKVLVLCTGLLCLASLVIGTVAGVSGNQMWVAIAFICAPFLMSVCAVNYRHNYFMDEAKDQISVKKDG